MSFTADMTKFCKNEAPDYLDGVIRKVLIETGERIVQRSPVGQPRYWESPAPKGYVGGRFRGNWQYGFSVMTDEQLDVIDASGSATIAKLTNSALSTKAVGVHFIYNTLPYAERLENEGWSDQAPFGMVSLVELEFAQIVRIAKQ